MGIGFTLEGIAFALSAWGRGCMEACVLPRFARRSQGVLWDMFGFPAMPLCSACARLVNHKPGVVKVARFRALACRRSHALCGMAQICCARGSPRICNLFEE